MPITGGSLGTSYIIAAPPPEVVAAPEKVCLILSRVGLSREMQPNSIYHLTLLKNTLKITVYFDKNLKKIIYLPNFKGYLQIVQSIIPFMPIWNNAWQRYSSIDSGTQKYTHTQK